MRTKGRPYRVDWPEYFVECREEDCDNTLFIADLGSCFSQKEADKKIKEKKCSESNEEGWKQRKNYWFCPNH